MEYDIWTDIEGEPPNGSGEMLNKGGVNHDCNSTTIYSYNEIFDEEDDVVK